MPLKSRLLAGVMVGLLFVGQLTLILPARVYAVLSSCYATNEPHSVGLGSTTDFTFDFTNSDSTASINWIKIDRPSSNYSIISASAPGWNAQISTGSVVYDSSSLPPGQNIQLTIRAQAANQVVSTEYWSIEASDTGNSSGSLVCAGTWDVEIVNSGSAAPQISNLQLSNLTSTSVSISWLTDQPSTTILNYGLDDGYGLTQVNNALLTSHTHSLNGLSANSTYHFQISATNDQSMTTISGDNTFLTPVAPSSIDSNPGITPSNPKIPILAKPAENIPPQIELIGDYTKPFKTSPIIYGQASDNLALAILEYSTDGGKNWLLVENALGLGTKQSDFSFMPRQLDDGNYQLIARAIDTSGNIGLSQPKTLIIDKLPPLIGGAVINVGAQKVNPDKTNTVQALLGVPQTLTLNAIGGPTSISVSAKIVNSKTTPQLFELTKSENGKLWSGILNFSQTGIYDLSINALDGGGNRTTRLFTKVFVNQPLKIIEPNSGSPVQSIVKVHTKDSETGNWIDWDGQSYDQQNPKKSTQTGELGLFLPPGSYYLEFMARDYQTVITHSFVLSDSQPLSGVINIRKSKAIGLGNFDYHLPGISFVPAPAFNRASPTTTGVQAKKNNLPIFSLTGSDGSQQKTSDLFGRLVVISFVNTWSPNSYDQLTVLQKIKNPQIKVIPVASGENLSSLSSYSKVSGLSINILADTTDQLAQDLKLSTVPAHYFVDRRGVIQKIVHGILSEQEIIDYATN